LQIPTIEAFEKVVEISFLLIFMSGWFESSQKRAFYVVFLDLALSLGCFVKYLFSVMNIYLAASGEVKQGMTSAIMLKPTTSGSLS
jgi:hypothetical protein